MKIYLIVRWKNELENNHQAYQGGLGVIETKRSKEFFSTN